MTRKIYAVTLLVEVDRIPSEADLTAAARALASGQPSGQIVVHRAELAHRPGMERFVAKQRRFRAARESNA